jgi:ABC-type polysaccharide/polyol phosphate export permease
MLNVGMLAWFFLSPVFYPVDFQLGRIPDALDWVAFLNPMTGILCAYRGVFIGDTAGSWFPIISFAVSWTVLLIGLTLFRRSEQSFADEL